MYSPLNTSTVFDKPKKQNPLQAILSKAVNIPILDTAIEGVHSKIKGIQDAYKATDLKQALANSTNLTNEGFNLLRKTPFRARPDGAFAQRQFNTNQPGVRGVYIPSKNLVDVPDTSGDDVLLHELVHAYDFSSQNPQGRGALFREGGVDQRLKDLDALPDSHMKDAIMQALYYDYNIPFTDQVGPTIRPQRFYDVDPRHRLRVATEGAAHLAQFGHRGEEGVTDVPHDFRLLNEILAYDEPPQERKINRIVDFLVNVPKKKKHEALVNPLLDLIINKF